MTRPAPGTQAELVHRLARVATAMRFVVAFVVWISLGVIQAPAQSLPVSYSQGEQAFNSLSVANRIKLQILLTAAGYWTAVPAERFNTRLFRAIQNWQSANGRVPDGVLTEMSFQQLVAEARPVVTAWQMQERFHPGTMRKIWVPTGLLQVADPISSGMLYKDPLDRIRMQHSNFENADLASSYQHLLDRARVEGRTVHFSIIRPNFYAMRWTSPAGTEAYVRYHRYGSGSYGFSMFWNPAQNGFYAERIAALVSASLSADIESLPFADPLTLLHLPAATPAINNSRPPSTGERSSVSEASPQSPVSPARVPAEKAEDTFSTGTGFFVSDRHVVTNSHVIDRCTSYAIRNDQEEIDGGVQVIARDQVNDLALLRTSLRPSKVAAVRGNARLGESVATFGYPHMDLLASTGNFTRGDVTALAGIGDDTSMLQMSTPVQSGNSGGALLDRFGHVVGVVKSKLSLRVALKTGDLPQNVNFSIKGSTLMSFLDSNRVNYKNGAPGEVLDPTELAEIGKAISVFVLCK